MKVRMGGEMAGDTSINGDRVSPPGEMAGNKSEDGRGDNKKWGVALV